MRRCCQVLPIGEVSSTRTTLMLTGALVKPFANPPGGCAGLEPRKTEMACQFGLVWGILAAVSHADRAT